MECVFCEIVAGRAPAHLVWADAHAVAFLDRRPLFPGHVLVVPRGHHTTLTDLPPDELDPYFRGVQRVAGAVAAGMEAAGTFVAANNGVSQSVPHLHFHVVPRRPKDGLRGFFWPRRRYRDEEEAASVAARLRRLLSAP
ncbi:HIT family protein [Streptomyces durbertensis]|uniref:HIT family protein n=1 Tax=Streptomyces durbertensis TaxID=2448886 RepID=A0ABR6EEL8_9ACTN|nr:HIT family protein [Streptomyces durbertensis]MBB1243405.1 HIT family protein [Streptomyces durbertensis]